MTPLLQKWRITVLSMCLATSLLQAEPRSSLTWDHIYRARFFEIGITGGTPAGFNFCFGYWMGYPKNWVIQFSGMHYGSSLHGMQLGFGRAFYGTHNFKAYYSVGLMTSHMTSGLTRIDFTGLSPILGFNWKNFVLEVGVGFGRGNNNRTIPFLEDPEAGGRFTYMLLIQFGLKSLFRI